MGTGLIQLSLAIAPAIAVSYALKHITLPWEKQKHFSERAEILSMLARDIQAVKSFFAKSLASTTNSLTPLPLYNWQKIKSDVRLQKYVDEPLFQALIRQLNEWEKI